MGVAESRPDYLRGEELIRVEWQTINPSEQRHLHIWARSIIA